MKELLSALSASVFSPGCTEKNQRTGSFHFNSILSGKSTNNKTAFRYTKGYKTLLAAFNATVSKCTIKLGLLFLSSLHRAQRLVSPQSAWLAEMSLFSPAQQYKLR